MFLAVEPQQFGLNACICHEPTVQSRMIIRKTSLPSAKALRSLRAPWNAVASLVARSTLDERVTFVCHAARFQSFRKSSNDLPAIL